MMEVTSLAEVVEATVGALLSEEAVDAVVRDIADAARAEWLRVAGADLFTTRRDYLAAVQPVEWRERVATIALVGVLPNIVEQGMDETDLHDTLLGPAVPVVPPGERGKHQRYRREEGGRELVPDGYYRAVPFRHATPGTLGAVGQPMGRAFEGVVEDAAALGREVYRRAKQLEPTTSQPGGPTQWGGRLPAGLVPKLKEYHATDIYAGMVRERKLYEKATQSQYATFRTISVDGAGAPVGTSPWIRPATEGRHFAKQVSEYVARVAPQAFTAYAKGMTG